MNTEEFESFHLLAEHPVLMFVLVSAILMGLGLLFTAILSKRSIRPEQIRDDKPDLNE